MNSNSTPDQFIRWQGHTIAQLTFAINLFFGMSIGSLVFAVTLIMDEDFLLSGYPKLFFQISLFLILLAVFSGCAAVVSRLLDFRFTARKIRLGEACNRQVSGVYKYRSKMLGKITWRLFWFQLFMLGVGLVGLISGVFFGYSNRIW